MSERDNSETMDSDEPEEGSVRNPFAEGDEGDSEDELPRLNLSKKRAAVLGTSFGLIMVGLLLICFLLSLAIATWTGN